jgi:hypothetical protein
MGVEVYEDVLRKGVSAEILGLTGEGIKVKKLRV